MSLPQKIKTDNGSGNIARETQDFLAGCGEEHSTGIPGNSTGQAIIERMHQVLKGLVDKQKTEQTFVSFKHFSPCGENGLSPQDRVLKAVYVMNHLWLVGNCSEPPVITHNSGLQQDSELVEHQPKVCSKYPIVMV